MDIMCYLPIYLIIHLKAYNSYADYLYLYGNTVENINCSKGKTIHIINAVFNKYESSCPGGRSCKEEIHRLSDTCYGKESCEVATRDYYSCHWTPRKITIEYRCLNKNTVETNQRVICGSLEPLHCQNEQIIDVVNFDYEYNNHFPIIGRNFTRNCINSTIAKSCEDNRSRCSILQIPTTEICFYLAFNLNITFECIKNDGVIKDNTGLVTGFVSVAVLTFVIGTIMYLRYKRQKKLSKTVKKQYPSSAENILKCKNRISESVDSFRDVETQYMSTTEGIYDVSNDRRHKEIIGINIYDRTTNNVYDVSNPDRQYRDNYTNDFSQ